MTREKTTKAIYQKVDELNIRLGGVNSTLGELSKYPITVELNEVIVKPEQGQPFSQFYIESFSIDAIAISKEGEIIIPKE